MLPHRVAAACFGALLATVLAGCGLASGTPPAPTPTDFQGIAADLMRRGIAIDHVVSGDSGCADPALSRTAISFRASGLDQPAPAALHLYIFGSRDSFQKLRPSVDACARSFITDPQTFESVDASPFVVVGQGPWGDRFGAAIRAGLIEAAGNGG
ncbi:MAG: hypothetical protein M3067_08090 [Chloroflexota bacterium]|nr:hypothetical protein [Chloroflexota bacterium]